MVLTLLLLGSVPALAADDTGNFVAKGVGTVPCSTFIAAAEQGGAAALGEYGGYVAGYTTAYNEITPTTFDVWAWQTVDTAMLFLLQRCKKNPELTFGAAVVELTRYFAAAAVTERENTRLVGTDERGFYLYESTYMQLLTALRAAGYSTDDPYAALMQYKKDNNVLSTANVHQILLLRLIGPTPE